MKIVSLRYSRFFLRYITSYICILCFIVFLPFICHLSFIPFDGICIACRVRIFPLVLKISVFHRIEWQPDQSCSEAYLGCSQTSVMLFFPEKLINGFQLLTIFTKSSIIDVWQGSKYTSSASISFFYIIKDWPMNFLDITLFSHETWSFPIKLFWSILFVFSGETEASH